MTIFREDPATILVTFPVYILDHWFGRGLGWGRLWVSAFMRNVWEWGGLSGERQRKGLVRRTAGRRVDHGPPPPVQRIKPPLEQKK